MNKKNLYFYCLIILFILYFYTILSCSHKKIQKPKIILKEEMKIIGLEKKITTGDIQEIIDLWNRFKERCNEIKNKVNNFETICIYHTVINTAFVGIEVTNFDHIPDGMKNNIISKRKYAVFTHKGAVLTIRNTYNSIYNKWPVFSKYSLDGTQSMVIYDSRLKSIDNPESQVKICIPVKKNERIKSRFSLKKVKNTKLYVMNYYGDYYDHKFSLEQMDIAEKFFCSCFSAMTINGENIFGRNFDYNDDHVALIFTNPTKGYASVSMVDLNFLGYSEKYSKTKNKLYYAPYLPVEGMNEYGLAIAVLSAPRAEPGIDSSKKTFSNLEAMRLVLDYAKNLDEAIDILKNINIEFRSSPCHYLISDALGNSTVIEFIGGNMVRKDKNKKWQVVTNIIVYNRNNEYLKTGCDRYKKGYEMLEKKNGITSQIEAMDILKNISQKKYSPLTRWSVVYNQNSGDIDIVLNRMYDKVYKYKLRMKK